MMIYRTNKGQEYDIETFAPDEREHVRWLAGEYLRARSCWTFHMRTANGIIEFIKRKGLAFETHPLYWIQLDMMGDLGVRLGEFTGKGSWMFLDDEGKQVPLERIVEENAARMACADDPPPPSRNYLN